MMSIRCIRLWLFVVLIEAHFCALAFSGDGIKTRSFVFDPRTARDKPKLVLITGAPGTGKSTFGMSVALDQRILKCVSTDTVRAVMRSFIPEHISPALHRSSYAPASESDDPVRSWQETCTVMEPSVDELVHDAISRGVGLVLEGVSIVPSTKLIKKWEQGGGVAVGCLLTIQNEQTHKSLLFRRGFIAGKDSGQMIKDDKKIQAFDRIRMIQDDMIRRATESNWILIEQKIGPDPLEIVANKLFDDECMLNGTPKQEQEHGVESYHPVDLFADHTDTKEQGHDGESHHLHTDLLADHIDTNGLESHATPDLPS